MGTRIVDRIVRAVEVEEGDLLVFHRDAKGSSRRQICFGRNLDESGHRLTSVSAFRTVFETEGPSPLNCEKGPCRPTEALTSGFLSDATPLADRPFHFELDEAVQLDRVLHRQLLGEGFDEALDYHIGRLVLAQAPAHQIKQLVLAYLRHCRLVLHHDVVFQNFDVRNRRSGSLSNISASHSTCTSNRRRPYLRERVLGKSSGRRPR